MKTRFLIILIVQFMIILLLLSYAYIQKGIADENLMDAQQMEKLAKQNEAEALKLQEQLKNCH